MKIRRCDCHLNLLHPDRFRCVNVIYLNAERVAKGVGSVLLKDLDEGAVRRQPVPEGYGQLALPQHIGRGG
jgi:hypothetical protein